MADLYRMSVLAKTERAISLRVQCIDPDAHVADDEGFALMALRDGVPYSVGIFGRWANGASGGDSEHRMRAPSGVAAAATHLPLAPNRA